MAARIFGQAFAAASRHTDVMLGTINTALLLTSSLLMAAAIEARKLQSRRLSIWLALATAAIGIVFLVIKGVEYWHEWDEHLFPGASFAFPGPHASGVRYFFFLYFDSPACMPSI